MKEIIELTTDENKRIDNAINLGISLYLHKIKSKFYNLGLENGFQMHLANEIQKQLDIHTFDSNERFVVLFEQNIPIEDNKKNYVDIVIEYYKGHNPKKRYLIELKYKKKSDSAPALGNIYSYIDINNLEKQKAKYQDIENCYFIFLTDLKTYINDSSKNDSTRKELPMYDGAIIKKDTTYKVTGSAALKAAKNYKEGFKFNNNYYINYEYINISNKTTLYYFILKSTNKTNN